MTFQLLNGSFQTINFDEMVITWQATEKTIDYKMTFQLSDGSFQEINFDEMVITWQARMILSDIKQREYEINHDKKLLEGMKQFKVSTDYEKCFMEEGIKTIERRLNDAKDQLKQLLEKFLTHIAK